MNQTNRYGESTALPTFWEMIDKRDRAYNTPVPATHRAIVDQLVAGVAHRLLQVMLTRRTRGQNDMLQLQQLAHSCRAFADMVGDLGEPPAPLPAYTVSCHGD